MNDHLEGIFPVLPTPFQESGAVDESALTRLVEFAANAGVAGVVFPGFASEVETLEPAERAASLRVIAQAAPGALKIVAGASAQSAEEAIEHGRSAAALGIHHLMIQPPKSLGATAAPVIEFLAKVASSLPHATIILQNAPTPRGSDLSPETIVEIASAVQQVRYVKEETLPAGPAISHILRHKPAHLTGVIGGGGARYILDEYARGACAAMPALELAPEHVALDSAWRHGSKQEAREIYIRTLPLLSLQAVYRMRLTKHVLMRRGLLDNCDVRAPTPAMDSVARADIDENLRELGIFQPQMKEEVS